MLRVIMKVNSPRKDRALYLLRNEIAIVHVYKAFFSSKLYPSLS